MPSESGSSAHPVLRPAVQPDDLLVALPDDLLVALPEELQAIFGELKPIGFCQESTLGMQPPATSAK
jgi:hypothetical protein